VLVWAGGGGDDLAKSPHMARIGNSVYPDMCPGDPTCSQFGFYQGGHPTPMMEQSLLYALTQYGYKQEIKLDNRYYTHAFTSKYGKCRVYKVQNVNKESKRWVANPENRICDAPGSWYCTGQYPPALDKLIASRRNFKQLEDFNVGQDAESEQYTQEYLDRMAGKSTGSKSSSKSSNSDSRRRSKKSKQKQSKLSEGLKFVGCFGSETSFSSDKTYLGGEAGAAIKKATKSALKQKRKYIAMAKNGGAGHSFIFDSLTQESDFPDSHCSPSCVDEEMACGCSDDACAGRSLPDGEDNLRRWAVYQVKDTFQAKFDQRKAKKDL